MSNNERISVSDFGPSNVVPVRVRMGSVLLNRYSSNPGTIESLSLPPHLRAEPQQTVSNRADRRRAARGILKALAAAREARESAAGAGKGNGLGSPATDGTDDVE